MTTQQETKAGECMQPMQPGEHHAKLEPFVGTFKAKVKMWMGPGEPNESTGTMVNEWDLGGRYVRQTYTGDDGGPFPGFEGRGYWGYNTVTNEYEGIWLDNACTMMQPEKGQVDDSGKVWTMHGSFANPETGQPMSKRTVITVRDDDRHTMEMFFDVPGMGEMKTMEIEYTRA